MRRFSYVYNVEPQLKRALPAFRELMASERIQIDRPTLEQCSEALVKVGRITLLRLIAAHELGEVTHLINGFGDFRFLSLSGLKCLSDFVVLDRENGQRIIAQDGSRFNPYKCDHHPWQSFAYASMAGIGPTEVIPRTELTLRELALKSRVIRIKNQHISEISPELGHLLFAAAHLQPDPDLTFKINERGITLRELAKEAVEDHYKGNRFPTVCLRTHLTEGVCAVGAMVNGLDFAKADAEDLLRGHLEAIELITAMNWFVRRTMGWNGELYLQWIDETTKLQFLINGAHILELTGFAHLMGYEFTESEKSLINMAMNVISSRVNGNLGVLHIDNLFSLAHLRRAIELWLEIDKAEKEGRPLSTVNLAAYKINFDLIDPKSSLDMPLCDCIRP